MLLHEQADFCSEFYIDDIRLASGPPEGVSFEGTVVKISQSLYSDSSFGEPETILITYSVAGLFGMEMPKTAIFNLSKTEDGPAISSSLAHAPFIKNGMVCFDLSLDLSPPKRRSF